VARSAGTNAPASDRDDVQLCRSVLAHDTLDCAALNSMEARVLASCVPRLEPHASLEEIKEAVLDVLYRPESHAKALLRLVGVPDAQSAAALVMREAMAFLAELETEGEMALGSAKHTGRLVAACKLVPGCLETMLTAQERSGLARFLVSSFGAASAGANWTELASIVLGLDVRAVRGAD
jgi:hypothetical protein